MEDFSFKTPSVRLIKPQALKASKTRNLLILVGSKKNLHPKSKDLMAWKTPWTDRLLKSLALRDEDIKEGEAILLARTEQGDPDILLLAEPKDQESFFVQQWCRDRLKLAVRPTHEQISFGFVGKSISKDRENQLAYAFGLALAARVFLLPVYGSKAKDQKPYQLKEILWSGSLKSKEHLERGLLEVNGNNLVRYLGFLPPNYLDPAQYGQKIEALAKEFRLSLKFHSKAELKKLGAEAFLAVDRGNPDSKGGIYEISYNPSRAKNKKPVALVGKGLCFDTGGYDVKTNGMMATMKGDMQGSAVALATICLAAKMKWPLRLKAFLGITENHISPKAYKADEVVKAMNGLSIEIVHTDAEGRMVLADTLALASKTKPELIMDFATLTGAAVRAIGTAYSAAFTNNQKFHSRVLEAGRESGERVWTFPLDQDFGKVLESPIADTLQCARGASVDHINAAFFLRRFVGEGIDWLHVDLSAAENKGGLGPTDSEYTGFGPRFALEFLRGLYKLS